MTTKIKVLVMMLLVSISFLSKAQSVKYFVTEFDTLSIQESESAKRVLIQQNSLTNSTLVIEYKDDNQFVFLSFLLGVEKQIIALKTLYADSTIKESKVVKYTADAICGKHFFVVDKNVALSKMIVLYQIQPDKTIKVSFGYIKPNIYNLEGKYTGKKGKSLLYTFKNGNQFAGFILAYGRVIKMYK